MYLLFFWQPIQPSLGHPPPEDSIDEEIKVSFVPILPKGTTLIGQEPNISIMYIFSSDSFLASARAVLLRIVQCLE